MNEPLNNSLTGVSFTGKTYNNHPQWYNQPLRLTKEQKRDPLPVLDDFFECYHLNEARQTLWEWLTEVLSSQRSIAIEPLERNNHIYFYEKIEGIIEAAYVMKKKIHKHRRRKERKKIKKNNRLVNNLLNNTRESANSNQIITATETAINEDLFNKPKQLIEYVDTAPLYVLKEVFKSESLSFLRDQLRDWLFVAISADCQIYEEGEQRKQLLTFQDQLLVLVEALFIIDTQNREKTNTEKQITKTDTTRLLSHDQIANPMQVVTTFIEKFPISYCIRELKDWLEAGISYAGEYPDNMSELQVLLTYRNVLCLIRAANRLLK
jgi:hypothetical protein